jgi:hypothetical protein
MKRSYYLFMLALVCLLAAAAPSHAQSTLRVNFQVPFAFTAGAALMPAGAYTISEDESGHALILPAQGGRAAAILLTRISGFTPGNGRASVSFKQRAGRYYLDTLNLVDGTIVQVPGLVR